MIGGGVDQLDRLAGERAAVRLIDPLLVPCALLYRRRQATQIGNVIAQGLIGAMRDDQIAHTVVGHKQHLRFAPRHDLQVVRIEIAAAIGETLGVVATVTNRLTLIVVELRIEAGELRHLGAHGKEARKGLCIGPVEGRAGAGHANAQYTAFADLGQRTSLHTRTTERQQGPQRKPSPSLWRRLHSAPAA
ncbi:hypothetical protein D3C81_1452210 [compost metagenome]